MGKIYRKESGVNKMKWTIDKRKLSELKEWDKNPRVLTEKWMKDLKKSLTKFGVAEPLVINLDNTIKIHCI